MEWLLKAEGHDDTLLRSLRHEIIVYLRRHADEDDAALRDAELVVAELLTNAVRHTVGASWVGVDWPEEFPTLWVADMGPGFDLHVELPAATSIGGRGMYLVSSVSERLEVRRRRSRGSIVTAKLPVRRAASRSIQPPRRKTNVLPRLDEALPGGGFGKESFLRALVVQLARAVAEAHGPDAAEAAVAQVGMDVGGQMEAEFRHAHGLVGRLTMEQVADCYVRLKHAIDGQFSVVELSRSRIVLENTRCPFGDAVLNAPSLCRMTSSVFGGIASNNSDDVAVVTLEERIAIGDPICRVVVQLNPATIAPAAHRYTAPSESFD